MKCLMCQKELENVPGRRKKQFCGSTCRSKYWYGQNVKVKKEEKPLIKEPTKSTSVLKPDKQLKANCPTHTAPKTLDELKSLCPANLTGLERSAWIATERQKYKI